VSPKASLDEVKRAFRQLAREWHPDINPCPEAAAYFREINRAYSFIAGNGDPARLILLCEVVEIKHQYAAHLQAMKRVMELAGIEPDPPMPEGNPQDEFSRKQRDLGFHLAMLCPRCKRRESCDKATGFDLVRDMHEEIQAKFMRKFFGGRR